MIKKGQILYGKNCKWKVDVLSCLAVIGNSLCVCVNVCVCVFENSCHVQKQKAVKEKSDA